MEKLLKLINELEQAIPKFEQVNLSVSQSSVGWHIEHSLLVIIRIIQTLKDSEPNNYKWRFSFSKILIFTINKIPRGRGKSPKAVQPQGIILKEMITKNIEIAKSTLMELDHLNSKSFFEHPYFGKLSLKPSKKFLLIHTEHHLKIIRDIMSS